MEGNFGDTDGSPTNTSELLEELNTKIESMRFIEDPPGSGFYKMPGVSDED